MNSYAVVYERDEEGWWIARVVGVRGVHSNGRTIEEARRRVRDRQTPRSCNERLQSA
jgi:predicted RNase H-like HicB family nuclease